MSKTYKDLVEIIKEYYNHVGIRHVYGRTAEDKSPEVYALIPPSNLELPDKPIVKVMAAENPDDFEAI